jgi:ABC-type nitrate/sulfonate/bicarbonate transport system substrate-binding protein
MKATTLKRSLLLSAVAAGIAFSGAANAQTKILAGTVFMSATVWPHFIAADKGYFKAAGIDVEIIATRSSAKGMQQIAAGSLDIVSSGIPDHLRAIDKGAPVKIIMNQIGTPPYMVYASTDIKKITDLKGKTVIIGGIKDVTKVYVESLFKPAGLMPGDYDYIYAGSTSNRFAALVAGGVQAAIMLPPFSLRAATQGFTNLGNIQSVLKDFPFSVYAVNTNYLKKNREAVIKFMAAILKGTAWLYDTKNKSEAADILVKWSRFKRPDALATYDIFFKEINAYRLDGVVTKEAYTKMMKVLVGWGDMKSIPPMSKFYDGSLLKEARKRL